MSNVSTPASPSRRYFERVPALDADAFMRIFIHALIANDIPFFSMVVPHALAHEIVSKLHSYAIRSRLFLLEPDECYGERVLLCSWRALSVTEREQRAKTEREQKAKKE